jgi:hydrogenase maturation protease
MAGRKLVIGVGNPDRGDDAAGLLAARSLGDLARCGVEVIERAGEATELLAALDGAEWAILVDAAAGLAPGEARRFDANASAVPATMSAFSSHGMGVPQAIELARALGRLPAICAVYAIGGESFETGAAMSPGARAGVSEVIERIREEVGQLQRTEPDA